MLINPHQMTKPDTTLLFHDFSYIYIYLMIWVDFFRDRAGNCSSPLCAASPPFQTGLLPSQLSFSSGTGSTAPGDQTERCGSARGNAKARVRAAHVPSPISPGTRPSGRGQDPRLCPCPADRRGERARSRERCRMYRGSSRLPTLGGGGNVSGRNFAKPQPERRDG